METQPNRSLWNAKDKLFALEINAWHEKAVAGCRQCEEEGRMALVAAWQAGRLLVARKREVHRSMGHGTWGEWVRRHFHGSKRTAERYMALARKIPEEGQLGNFSLRQTYMRLGLSVEAKGIRERITVPALPTHLRVAHRFLAAIPTSKEILRHTGEERLRWQRDLLPTWERLRLIFPEGGDQAGGAG